MSEPLGPHDSVVVVGAGLAGWRLAATLRHRGFAGPITLVGEESARPYDRPPLTKQVLAGSLALEELALEREVDPSLTWRLGVRARALDVDARRVILADGDTVTGTRVVVATGVRARHLDVSADDRLHYVRRLEDVTRLESDLAGRAPSSPVAVIGGGFIGAEVATSLAHRGFRPIVLEAMDRPLLNVLGPDVAGWLAELPALAGIELRTGCAVAGVTTDGDDVVISLVGGATVRAPVVVAGIGALPNTEWLEGSGLALDNGVVVDEDYSAAPGVAAIGDVARFPWAGPAGVERARIEHWQVANDHAMELARRWTAPAEPHHPLVPYFWSDQYGAKIQVLGHPRPTDVVQVVAGDPRDARFVALYSRDEVVTGVVALRSPRALALARPILLAPTTLGDALARAPWER